MSSHMWIREAGAIPKIYLLLSIIQTKYDKNSALRNLQQWPSKQGCPNFICHKKAFASHKTNPPWSSLEIFLSRLLTFGQMVKVEKLKWCWLAGWLAKLHWLWCLPKLSTANVWPIYRVQVLPALCSRRQQLITAGAEQSELTEARADVFSWKRR